MLETLKKLNRWDFIGACNVDAPNMMIRWFVYSFVCVAILSEWIVVGFILLHEDQPSERSMTTLTNCGFVPMVLFCFYHVIVSGKRVDLVVDGLFALGTANASLWYHMCGGQNPAMNYCKESDGSKDYDVWNLVMWWDFAASYMMFIQAALVLADLREVILKIPMYVTSIMLCYEGMREPSVRTKSLGSEHIKWALGFACMALLMRCVYVLACFYRLQSHSISRAVISFFKSLNLIALGIASICFCGGMLCAFVWADQSVGALDSAYTTPHGFWHIGMAFASGSTTWLAVSFAQNWRMSIQELKSRRHPKSPSSKPPADEVCEMVEIEPLAIDP